MEIKVLFERNQTFNDSIEQYTNRINLSEIVSNTANDVGFERVLLDILEAREDEDDTTGRIFDTMIVTTEDCAGINTHFLENIEKNINTIGNILGIERVIFNNPPKFLLEALRRIKGVKIGKNTDFYSKPTKESIQNLKRTFDNKIVGQMAAKDDILRNLITQLIRKNNKPLVLMFYGKPGIGKTETAKYMANVLYGNKNIVREQMTMAGGEESVRYFKAAKHSEESFSKKLLKRQGNLILLDEFALSPDFFQTSFYQMFDEGIYSDSNFEVDVSNSIVICTSNLLSTKDIEEALGDALYSRFDGFVKFDDFTDVEKKTISEDILDELYSAEELSEYKEYLDYEDLKVHLSEVTKELSNFRNIRRYVENMLADELMNNLLD